MKTLLDRDDLDRANATRLRLGWSLLTWDQAVGAIDYWSPDLISKHTFLVRLITESTFGKKEKVR
jgi:hypothetical protein